MYYSFSNIVDDDIKCFEVVEYKQCISKNGYEYCKSLLRDSDMKV